MLKIRIPMATSFVNDYQNAEALNDEEHKQQTDGRQTDVRGAFVPN